MNADYRNKTTTLLAVFALLAIGLTGCATNKAFKRGLQAETSMNWEAAVIEYKIALDRNPGNIEFQLKYNRARFNAAFQHFEAGRRALEKDDYQTAKLEFSRALELDPGYSLAQQQLEKIAAIEAAKTRGAIPPEVQYDDMRQVTRTDPSVQAQLEPRITGPIDLHMTQDSRAAFESLAEIAGFNVIFDRDFRGTRIPIDLNKVDIFEALDILALQTGSFWKVLNKSTILVSGDNQTKRRDYDDLILKTIYLTNSVTSTEITEAITALRTLLNMRYLAQSTSMNAIIIRDTADRIAIAEKIIDDLDKAKPEVLVQATVLEVDVSMLRQLGILPPQGTSVAFTGGNTTTTTTGGTTTTTTSNTTTLRGLSQINSGSFSITIPPTTAQFLAQSSKTKLVQNPEVRATDGKLASIRIGSQVPIASGSFQPAFVGATGTPVVNFQFVDVGVNLDITPRVLLNREVSMTVMVQVRALAGDRDVGGVTQPVLTNRQVQHEIRLTEGETNILGGIITDTESTSLNGLPGLKNIPMLRYLFAQEKKTRDQTEIIIMLTPHILRMPNIQEVNMRGLNTGSEQIPRLRSPQSLGFGKPPATAPTPSTPAAPAPGGAPAATPPATAPATQPPAPVPTPTPPTQPPAAAAPNAPPGAPRTTNSTVSFAPSPVTLPAAGTATVNIVGNGTDFYGVDLTLTFDPKAITIREVREGGFLSRDGQIVAFVQRMETENGMLRLSLERPPGVAPLSGTGNLVTLVLQRGAQPGPSTLRITDFRIRDAQQNVSVGRNAEVSVSAP
jgi:general secretion pathway protein D